MNDIEEQLKKLSTLDASHWHSLLDQALKIVVHEAGPKRTIPGVFTDLVIQEQRDAYAVRATEATKALGDIIHSNQT